MSELRALRPQVMSSWHRFLDVFEPHRPELYRYCRHLTRSPWDAEDLAQDALMRAYATLGTLYRDVPNPRAWLFRVASNLWVDRVRRARCEVAVDPAQLDASVSSEPRSPREAAGTLLGQLSPQQRAAVVLKDVFDFSLEEVAEMLSTTVGSVKTALHRGRGKLLSPDDAAAPAPPPAVLSAFCDAFNARDLERMTALLLDTATVEIAAVVTEYGPDAAKDPHTGSFAGTMSPITVDERGGVAAEFLVGYRPTIPTCEVRAYRDEWILVFWYEHDDGPRVRTVMRVAPAGDRIGHVRNFFFSPDVIAEVCSELELPHRTNGYRYWLPLH